MSRRIVSLVPSLTESLVAMGLRDDIVGCTKFCVEPPDLHRQCTLVGGTKDFDRSLILSLHPTHVLANQEENPREAVLDLATKVPTHISFPRAPEDVPSMLRDIGHFLSCPEAAEHWALDIDAMIASLEPRRFKAGPRFLYFIWRDPYMLAGVDTYISRLFACAGWQNAIMGLERYPTVRVSELSTLSPDLIILSSEPYPFRRRDADRLKGEWPSAPPILKVDGRLLSWHGTQTLAALRWVADLDLTRLRDREDFSWL